MKWHIDPSKLVFHDKLILKRVKSEYAIEWYFLFNGKYHNPNGPAYIARYKSGDVAVVWYTHGLVSVLDHPTFIIRTINGKIVEKYGTIFGGIDDHPPIPV